MDNRAFPYLTGRETSEAWDRVHEPLMDLYNLLNKLRSKINRKDPSVDPGTSASLAEDALSMACRSLQSFSDALFHDLYPASGTVVTEEPVTCSTCGVVLEEAANGNYLHPEGWGDYPKLRSAHVNDGGPLFNPSDCPSTEEPVVCNLCGVPLESNADGSYEHPQGGHVSTKAKARLSRSGNR